MSSSTRRRYLAFSAGYGALSAAIVPLGFAIAHGSAIVSALYAVFLAPVFLLGAITGIGKEWSLLSTCLFVFVIQFVAAILLLNIVGFIKRDVERTK
jgi:hypothetical protein